jgi:ATP-dependent DNA helicase DinG
MSTSSAPVVARPRSSGWPSGPDDRTGDLAELDWSPSDRHGGRWRVGSDECPGATRCPLGRTLLRRGARARAASADVIVVNTPPLRPRRRERRGAILPEHDVVVVDEAHQLEDVMSDTVGVQLTPGRFVTVGAPCAASSTIRPSSGRTDRPSRHSCSATCLRDHPDSGPTARPPAPGSRCRRALVDRPADASMQRCRCCARSRPTTRTRSSDGCGPRHDGHARSRQIDVALGDHDGYVAFVSADHPTRPRLEIAPSTSGPCWPTAVWASTAPRSSPAPPSPRRSPDRVGLDPSSGPRSTRRGEPLRLRAARSPVLRAAPPRPAITGSRAAATHEEIEALDHGCGRSDAGAVHQLEAAMDRAAAALRDRLPTGS